jgi:hypothetical protein
MIGFSRIPVRDLPLGGTSPVSYDITLGGTIAAIEANPNANPPVEAVPASDITIPADDGMESMGDAKYSVDGMHSYVAAVAAEASEVADAINAVGDVLITGMADTKSTTVAVAVTLNAMDSHPRDVQMASRVLPRSFTIGRRPVLADPPIQGTDPRNEEIGGTGTLAHGTYEKTFSADDFPDRLGTADQLPQLDIMATDEQRQNVGGTIQGADDEDWFLIRGIAPDYLLQLQIVGNADFELIPAASVTETDADGHTLMGRKADLPDYDLAYDGLRCGDYYVKVTGDDEAVYTLGWRFDNVAPVTN